MKNNLKAVKPKEATVPNIKDILNEYDSLRSREKVIKDRKAVLAKEIKKYAVSNGVKNDTGSHYVEEHGFIFGNQAKKSVSFNDKAIQFLKDNGFNDCIQTIEKVDEDAVSRRIDNEEITIAQLESITTTKVNFSIDVKVKENLPVVEETEVKMVASTKPKTTLKKARKK